MEQGRLVGAIDRLRKRVARAPRSAGFASIGVAATMAVAAVAVVSGTGFRFARNDLEDGTTWIRSAGGVVRVNGSSGEIDMRIPLDGATGEGLRIIQRNGRVLVLDTETGRLSALDPGDLTVAAEVDLGSGEDLDVALGRAVAFVIDMAEGVVRHVDPDTLEPVGAPLDLVAPLSTGEVDRDDRLWTVETTTGDAVGVEAGGDGAREVDRVAVADPGSDVEVGLVDGLVVVVDLRTGRQTELGGPDGARDADLPLPEPSGGGGDGGGYAVPSASSGPWLPVTSTGPNPSIVSAAPGGAEPVVTEISASSGSTVGAEAIALGGRLYVGDQENGRVLVFEGGRLVDEIVVPEGAGGFDMFLDDGLLWINAVESATALLVDDSGTIFEIDKEVPGVPSGPVDPVPDPAGGTPDPAPGGSGAGPDPAPGGNGGGVGGGGDPVVPPTTTTTTAPAPTQPAPPGAEPPGAPGAVTGTPGNRSVSLAWGAAVPNGAPVTEYRITWPGGSTRTTGATTARIDGLRNGETYRFTVVAVNAAGTGPPARSGEVEPTSEVPGAPGGVVAELSPGGVVTVSWEEADGEGNEVAGYVVEAAGDDGTTVPLDELGANARSTTATAARPEAAGGTALALGVTYTVSVVAVDDRGVTGPAGTSGAVTPAVAPDAPATASAATVPGTSAGRIVVTWELPVFDGGADLTGFVVKVPALGVEEPVGADQTALEVDAPPGSTYDVTVQAENAVDLGPETAAQVTQGSRATVTGFDYAPAGPGLIHVAVHASAVEPLPQCSVLVDGGEQPVTCGQTTGIQVGGNRTVSVQPKVQNQGFEPDVQGGGSVRAWTKEFTGQNTYWNGTPYEGRPASIKNTHAAGSGGGNVVTFPDASVLQGYCYLNSSTIRTGPPGNHQSNVWIEVSWQGHHGWVNELWVAPGAAGGLPHC